MKRKIHKQSLSILKVELESYAKNKIVSRIGIACMAHLYSKCYCVAFQIFHVGQIP